MLFLVQTTTTSLISFQRTQLKLMFGVKKKISQAFSTTRVSSTNMDFGMARERGGKTMATSTLDSIKTTRGVKARSMYSRTTPLTRFIMSNMSMERWLKSKN
jgi:hypothetical protein